MSRLAVCIGIVSFAIIAWMAHVNGQMEREIAVLRQNHPDAKLQAEVAELRAELVRQKQRADSWRAGSQRAEKSHGDEILRRMDYQDRYWRLITTYFERIQPPPRFAD